MRHLSVIKFPYRDYKGVACPIIPLHIRGVRLDAYVDSGAFGSIFSAEAASALGINISKGKSAIVLVGNGSHISVFYHKLMIKIGPIAMRATIGFSEELDVDMNLLGRKDIFDRFRIIFDDRRQIISFAPH